MKRARFARVRLLVLASTFLMVTSAVVGIAPGAAPALAATAVLRVGGYDAARTTDTLGLYDTCGSGLQGLLTNPANFGPSGTFDVDFDIAPSINAVTSASDLAGIDVFFTGFVMTMEPAEQQLLYDYVLGGGNLVLTPDDHRYATAIPPPDDSTHGPGQALLDLFGLDITVGATDPDPNTALPPFSTGPFGTPAAYFYGGNSSAITTLGPSAFSAGTNGGGDPSLAYIPARALGPDAGAVVIAGDVDFFTNPSNTCAGSAAPPGGGSVGNATLINNIFAYLAAPAVTFSGYSSSRAADPTHSLYGSAHTTARGRLLDTAEFGPAGTVPVQFVDGGPVDSATPPNLDGVDVFFTGYTATTSYDTSGDKDDLLQYVLDGGALIATTDGTSWTMVDVFGVTQGDGGSGTGTVTNPSHTVVAGPFGSQGGTFAMGGSIGHYTTPLPNGVIELATNGSGAALAVIEPGTLAPGSGPVVLASDVDIFTNGSFASTNANLVGNIFAWTATAEAPIQALIDAAAPGDVIDIPAGVYNEQILIDKDLTLQGPVGGAATTILDGSGFVEGFEAPIVTVSTGVTATLRDLQIRGGSALAGGGIYNEGDLTLEDVTVFANVAAVEGGGIYNAGVLSLEDTAVVQNAAGRRLFWDFENQVPVGGVSTSTGLATGPISGFASQTGGGPAENVFGAAAGWVHLTRPLVDSADPVGNHYPFIEFTLDDPGELRDITFQHFHNHNLGFPTNPSYNVQLQLDTGGGYVDIGAPLTLSNANFGAIDTIDLGSTPVPAGTHRMRWVARNLAGGATNTNTEYFALNDLTLTLAGGDGGGISGTSSSSFDMAGGQISANSAGRGGGAYLDGVAASLSGVAVTANEAFAGGGGGLYLASITSPVTITDSTVGGATAPAANTSTGPGAGLYVLGSFSSVATLVDTVVQNNVSDANGGGIYALFGAIELEGVQVRDNSAVARGGGVFGDSAATTIVDSAAQASVISGNSAAQGGGIQVDDDALVVTGAVVSGNTAGSGGGINVAHPCGECGASATITDTVITDNAGTIGGGLRIQDDVELSLTSSDVSGNTSTSSGAGLHHSGYGLISLSTLASNVVSGSSDGGAVYTTGSLTIEKSTIGPGNQATNGGGIRALNTNLDVTDSTVFGNVAGANGGGIRSTGGSTKIVNSTISGNEVTMVGSGNGGGLSLTPAAPSAISNTTITDNTGESGAGGVVLNDLVTVSNSIIAGNDFAGAGPSDCSGVPTSPVSGGYNIIGAAGSCSAFVDGVNGDQVGVVPGALALGPLAVNGGPTPTHAVLVGSPALDAGNPAPVGSSSTACPTADQRGAARPFALGCDVGSFERGEVFPTSYAMLNGSALFNDYRDDTYTGCPCPSGTPLSGGLGELTDGVVATLNWRAAETSVDGPYVGWWNIDPVITFSFAQAVDLGTIVVHVDDSNNDGGVKPPASVRVEADAQVVTVPVTDPPGGEPIAVTVDVSALPTSDTFVVTLVRQQFGVNDDWVFLSEAEFFLPETLPVPPDIVDFAYAVTPGSAPVGVGEVSILDIPIEAIVGASGAQYESAPIGSIPVNSIPVGSINLQASPVGSIPVNSIPLNSIPVGSIPLGSIPLNSIPINSIGGWEAILNGTTLEGSLLQDVTLKEVLSLSPAPAGLADVTLNDIALQDSPLGSISLPSIALGDQNLLAIDPDLCDGLAPLGSPAPCDNAATDSLIELEFSGAAISSVPLGSIPLNSIPLNSIPVGSIPLNSIPVGSIPVGSIPLGSIPLGSIPLNSIALNGTPLGSIPVNSIGGSGACALLVVPYDCGTLSISGTDSLYQLALALEGAGSSLAASPVGSIPLNSIPLGSIPLNSIDLLAAPVGSIPLGSIPVGSIPLGSIDVYAAPVGSIPIGSIPLNSIDFGGQDGCDLLAGSGYDCGVLPGVTGASTLAEFIAALPTGTRLSDTPLGSIPVNSIPVGSIPVGSIPVNSIPVGSIPLNSIDLAKSPLGSIPIGSIGTSGACALLVAPLDCVALSVDDLSLLHQLVAALEGASSTLADTPIGSIPVGSIPVNSIPLNSIDMDVVLINNTPIGSIPLNSIGLGDTGLATSPLGSIPVNSIPAGSIGNVIECASFDCTATSTKTLGDAEIAGVIKPDATLGDLGFYGSTTYGDLAALLTLEVLYGPTLLGTPSNDYGNLTFGQILISLLLRSDFPWETLPLADLGLQAVAPTGTVTYSGTFDLTGDGWMLPGSLTAVIPEDFYYVPGSSVVRDGGPAGPATPLGDPVVTDLGASGVQLDFSLALSAGTTYVVEWEAVPGFDTGSFLTSATVGFVDVPAPTGPVTDTAEITVTEFFTGNNGLGSAASIDADTLVFSHISTPGVSDFFSFPAGPVGTRHAVFVSQFDADTDLVLYKPQTDPVSAVAPSSIPLNSIPIEDDGLDYAGNKTQEPELEADIDIAAAPLGSISINRGTTPEAASSTLSATPLTPGEPYTIQISGYQGLASSSPYVVRVKRDQAVSVPVCTPAVYGATTGGPSVDLSALPAGLNTIFLMHWQRLAAAYGEAQANDILAAVNALIADGANGVVGAVIPVDNIASNTTIAGAFGAWDANPCDAEAANQVVKAITAVISQIQGAHPTLGYVTLVGNDDMLPFARLADLTAIANEGTYTEGFSDNALFGALTTRHYFSDDPYGELAPIPWLDRYLHVPDLAVGRLVEDPADIVLALDHFVTFDGLLDPQTASVAGYDFLDNGSDVIRERLENILGPTNVSSLIDQTGASPASAWTRADLLDELDLVDATPGSDTADIFSVNAHSDHHRQLPSFGDANDNELDLFEIGDVGTLSAAALAGDIIFTMGCHAGLSVSDIGIGSAQEGDWAQTYLGLGALYVGNSGYGYGDTVSVALSERLMAEFAENVDGSMTAGQAMMFAKQEYFAQLGQYTVYDEKAMQQAIFYGLPMYALGTTPPETPPAPLPTAVDPGTGLEASSLSFAPTYETNPTPQGTYYSIEDQTQQTHYRPTQPLDAFDVTQDDLIAHGAIVTQATTKDFGGIDPVYFRPIVTGSLDAQPEVPGDDIATPVFGLNIATYNRPGTGPSGEPFEQAQRASIIAGSFRSVANGSEIGTQRLTQTANVKVFYASPTSTDFAAPRIEGVQAVLVGNHVSFTVKATDDAGVAEVLVLYRNSFDSGTGEATWISTSLVPGTGSTYSGGGPIQSSAIVGGVVDYKVWVIDTSGNVATTDSKNVFWQAATVPPPPTPTQFTLNIPNATVAPWYTSNTVTVGLTGTAGVIYTVSGGSPASIAGSGDIVVSGDGYHEVTVSGGGETATFVILIDSTDPLIDIESPIDGAVLALNSAHAYDFTCVDSGSGVNDDGCVATPGVASGDPVDTSVFGDFTLSVTATDDVGNSATAEAFYVVSRIEILTGSPAAVNPTPVVPINETINAQANVGSSLSDFTWNWGDGSPDTEASVAAGLATGTHAYAGAGVYTVSLLQDGVVVLVFEYVVAYDPDGGFVTGGGWIDSPLGAYVDDPLLTGKANFGFVSKYKKGAGVPTGNTQFKFKAADFKFESTTYEWLVIAGSRAKYKGNGLVNDGLAPTGSEYKFMLTGFDADVIGNDAHTVDRFRIRIWYEEAGGNVVVYDNCVGCDEDTSNSDAETVLTTTELGGGSIVIHKAKGAK